MGGHRLCDIVEVSGCRAGLKLDQFWDDRPLDVSSRCENQVEDEDLWSDTKRG